MLLNPISRSHLISPFGVGALSIAKDGSTMITASLDYWFHPKAAEDRRSKLNVEEYKIEEWRLQKILATDYFLLPPDFRDPHTFEQDPTNLRLTIPAFRFPKWHVCPYCGALFEFPLTLKSRPRCKVCEKKGMKIPLVQVDVIALCDFGHIRDFPWREWVHRDSKTSCKDQMKLSGRGGTLQSHVVKCGCGATRALANITQGDGTSSILSDKLNKNGEPFLCDGQRPWLGPRAENNCCGHPLLGALKGASNVYFPEVLSAIYLPRKSEKAPSDLVELFESPLFSPLLKALLSMEDTPSSIDPQYLRSLQSLMLSPYSDEQIRSAIEIVAEGLNKPLTSGVPHVKPSQDSQEDLRRLEYEQFSTEQNEQQLQVTLADLTAYDTTIMRFFSKLAMVKKLRETRVLVGFSRIYADSALSPKEKKALLRKEPAHKGKDWLPATLVHGEGLFIEFNQELLQSWENQAPVFSRIEKLLNRQQILLATRRVRERTLSARFVLIHTFAHLLINQLTFECGYATASLRERLYISTDTTCPMAGLLIYTASGDSEGTLGGLVAMGRKGNLEPTILRCIEKAQWCSVDPVCMEMGSTGGQGPDSCNLAACHNCALVPETACEVGNRFLDRATIVGDLEGDQEIGFFRALLSR